MARITVGKENSTLIDLAYEDHGKGPPVILLPGLGLTARAWEKQIPMLIQAGYRVVSYDRRGFGESSQPAVGYDFDTLAADLHTLISTLELRDISLVGFSMGGGEVVRYLGRYGSKRVRAAVLLGAIPPYEPRTTDKLGLDRMKKAIVGDRPAFLSGFLADVYNADVLGGTRVSDEFLRATWNASVPASPKGTLDCISALATDLRRDLEAVDVPTLILHGDADRIAPLDATAVPAHDAIEDSRLVVVEGAPHGMNWTHADDVNRELLDFLQERAAAPMHARAM